MALQVRDYRSSSGTPRAYDNGLFKTPDGNSGYRPRPHIFTDTPRAVSQWDWQRQIDLARQIFARVPTVHGAVCQKNLYSVGCGWKFHYTGEDEAWGREAEEYLNLVWYPSCDIRGEPYDFWLDLYLDGCAVDRDGDEAMVLVRPEELGDYEGPLKLAWYPAHRIGSGKAKALKGSYNSAEMEVESGPFKGARICNGVIKDRHNTTIGYRILTGASVTMPDEQKDLDANACQVLFEPDWNDLYRGLPRSAVSCLHHLDIEDIDHFLKRQVKRDATMGITVHNERGGPMNPTQLISSEEIPPEMRADVKTMLTTQDVIVEQLVGNETEYFKAGTGGKIEALNTNRPSPNTEAFVARIETQALFSLGWFRQLMDPSQIGGASVRAIQDQARNAVKARQHRTVRKRAMRASVAALADAMNRGVIPPNDLERWWLKLAWTLPAELTVDAGYDEKADLEHLRFGTTTAGIVCGKKGRGYSNEVLPVLGKESQARIREAKRISTAEGVPLELVLNDLRMANPNGLPPNSLDPEKEEKANDPKENK